MSLKQMEQQVAQLSPQEQLKLVAYIVEQLSAAPLVVPTKEIEEQPQRTRLAEVDAWLAECDAVAESIEGKRHIRCAEIVEIGRARQSLRALRPTHGGRKAQKGKKK
jgi:hypothetical protein